ncbi:MAG: hypothetical protein ACKOA8_05200, partial [Deltaproteobacteria bacterium]
GQCVRYLTQLALPYAVEHHSGKTIRAKNGDTDPTSLLLGERIGLGDRGGLYRIDPSSNLPGISKDSSQLVAKIPHTVRFSKNPTPHPQAELEMKREVETYERLKSHWIQVEGDPKYPKDPAWQKGVLPTAAIIKTFESREGTILIKPEIQGASLKKIYDQYKGKLPTDMENSLREIYSTIDAISSQVKTPIQDTNGNWIEGRPFYTDINPANLVWVSEPAQMKNLGLKRPSFIFYEMTPLINRMPQYLPLTDSPN